MGFGERECEWFGVDVPLMRGEDDECSVGGVKCKGRMNGLCVKLMKKSMVWLKGCLMGDAEQRNVREPVFNIAPICVCGSLELGCDDAFYAVPEVVGVSDDAMCKPLRDFVGVVHCDGHEVLDRANNVRGTGCTVDGCRVNNSEFGHELVCSVVGNRANGRGERHDGVKDAVMKCLNDDVSSVRVRRYESRRGMEEEVGAYVPDMVVNERGLRRGGVVTSVDERWLDVKVVCWDAAANRNQGGVGSEGRWGWMVERLERELVRRVVRGRGRGVMSEEEKEGVKRKLLPLVVSTSAHMDGVGWGVLKKWVYDMEEDVCGRVLRREDVWRELMVRVAGEVVQGNWKIVSVYDECRQRVREDEDYVM